ncbi:MAG: hypothetical protein KBF28_02185 [Gemmatimonadales bacterium]|nr:hypothetical protein [Gemmatimonadales bacterium]
MKSRQIIEAYRVYLERGRNPPEAELLAMRLAQAGEMETANLLRMMGQKDKKVGLQVVEGGPFQGRKCHISTSLPDALPGELWFDPLSLQTLVLVARAEEPSLRSSWRWLATRPVSVWQFVSFARMVKGVPRDDFGLPDDYLDVERWRNAEPAARLTLCYHDEAIAYSHFWGCVTTTEADLEMGRDWVTPDVYSEMLPTQLKLWSGSESSTEFLREAFSRETLGERQDDGDDKIVEWIDAMGGLEALARVPAEDRGVFAEWERHLCIGLSTAVPTAIGLIDSVPRESWCAVLEGRLWR